MVMIKTHDPYFMEGWNAFMRNESIESILGRMNFDHGDGLVRQMFRRYDAIAGYTSSVHWRDKERKGLLT